MNFIKALVFGLIAVSISLSSQAQTLSYSVSEKDRTIESVGLPLLTFTIPNVAVDSATIQVSDFGAVRSAIYSFSKFADASLKSVELLKITVPQTSVTHLFLIINNRLKPQYSQGWCTNILLAQNTGALDINNYYWEGIARFYVAPINQITPTLVEAAASPLSIFGYGVLPTNMTQFFSEGTPRALYYPLYIKRVLDVVASNPAIILTSGTFTAISTSLTIYPSARAIDREEIALKFKLLWPMLSIENKVRLLQLLVQGDSRSIVPLAPLAVELISQASFYYSSFTRSIVMAVALNPDISISMRKNIFGALVTMGSKPNFQTWPDTLSAMKEILDSGSDVILQRSDYEVYLTKLAQINANFANANYAWLPIKTLQYLNTNFPSLLSQNAKNRALNDYSTRRAALLAATDFKTVAWMDLQIILGDTALLANDTALITSVLDKTIAKIKAQFSEKLADKNNYLPIDGALKAAIRLMKRTGIYNDAQWINPLLFLYNPKFGAELSDNSLYGRKMGKIISLWSNHRIFFMDLTGGMSLGGMKLGTTVSYADAVFYLGRTYPGMIDQMFLRNYGNTTAFDGTVAMNWFATDKAAFVVKTMYHEGGHAMMSAYKARTPWSIFHNYWFQDKLLDPNGGVSVSRYSLYNNLENHAELLSYWHEDGEFWLSAALDYYAAGYKNMLNQFIQLSLPMFVDGPLKGRIRLTKIAPDGVTTAYPLVGGWLTFTNGTVGNMRNGYFRFWFKNEKIKLRFQDGKITEVLRTPG